MSDRKRVDALRALPPEEINRMAAEAEARWEEGYEPTPDDVLLVALADPERFEIDEDGAVRLTEEEADR